MRSLNTKKYAKYYILLEKCIKYYNDYQILLKEKYNIELTKKIKIKEQENMSLIERMDVLMKKMDNQTKQMKKQNKKMDKQSEQLTELQVTVNKILSKLNSCVHMPTDNDLSDRFVVMKSPDDYYVIRAQERNIYNAIRRQEYFPSESISLCNAKLGEPNSLYIKNIF